MKLGRYPEMKLARAREKAREARGEIGEGNDPLIEKRAQAASQTVSDLVENYVARHASTKRTGPAIARRLRFNVTSQIGGIKLSELHRRDITRCLDAIKDRGADIEANRVFEDVRAMVRWARGRGDLDATSSRACANRQRPSSAIASLMLTRSGPCGPPCPMRTCATPRGGSSGFASSPASASAKSAA